MSGAEGQDGLGALLQSVDDIVVDTNIWIHAGNPGVDEYEDALRFVIALKASRVAICFESGASPSEAKNESKILSEYYAQVQGSGVGRQVLTYMLANSRWTTVDPKVPHDQHRAINRNVNDPSDRIFARVATKSAGKRLVTHDKRAFPPKCKKALRKACNVSVQSCAETLVA